MRFEAQSTSQHAAINNASVFESVQGKDNKRRWILVLDIIGTELLKTMTTCSCEKHKHICPVFRWCAERGDQTGVA